MSLVVTRYGGIMATKPKTKTFELEQLEPGTRQLVEDLLRSGADAVESAQRLPDGYTYSFELSEGKASGSVQLRGSDVPQALRRLLP